MLRVSPDGKQVWVQTAQANTNVVLDAETMAVLQTTPTGRQPVTCGFGPPGGRYGLVTHFEDTFIQVLDRQTGRPVKRLEVGAPQANPGFTPDGRTAFVTVFGADEVAVIDLGELEVVGRIKTGGRPMGLALLDVDAGSPPTDNRTS